jgi:ATP-dependent RNA helicase DeaD
MLRMGFIEDVEWILSQTPADRQVALFSATMPAVIRRIAQQHLKNPAEVTIRLRTTTAETIHQRYWIVTGVHKLDALTRLLETEPFDAVLVFVRTRIAAVELSDRLQARGYATAALNGDMPQKQREQTVGRLKAGKLDILVATDVAARGLDVERISHVVNFDIPNDTEAYVHRIGRTGRAGRSGEAILFLRLVNGICCAPSNAPRARDQPMELPSATPSTTNVSPSSRSAFDASAHRISRFSRFHGAPIATARCRSDRHRRRARANGAGRQTVADQRRDHFDKRPANARA